MHKLAALLAAALALSAAASAQQTPAAHTIFELRFPDKVIDGGTGAELKGPFSGRVVVSATTAPDGYTFPTFTGLVATPETRRKITREDIQNQGNFYGASRDPSVVLLAAAEVTNVKPGDVVTLDLDADAAPKPFSSLPAGSYAASIVFDSDHNLAFHNNPSTGDFSIGAQSFRLPAERVTFTVRGMTWEDMPDFPMSSSHQGPDGRIITEPMAIWPELRAHMRDIDFVSPSLSAFNGKETRIHGRVLLPPGYENSTDTYPVIYRFEEYGWSFNTVAQGILGPYEQMYGNLTYGGYTAPPMIWVFLDQTGPTGVPGFTDSANNGPRGKALTEELIPYLEKQYRMDAKASGRFLYGDQAGGWIALWLQTAYPKLFGGAWATAPDPVDFHAFSGTDIYAASANVFAGPDGKPTPYVRKDNVINFKTQSDFESVLGKVSGQFASFDWVFSPRGPNGKPASMFDRFTGAVDSKVAAYWREHYDISDIIRRDAAMLKPDLTGKLHVFVGTDDMYFRDAAVQRLKDTLAKAGIAADINVAQNRGFYGDNSFDGAMRAPANMYAIARPASDWRITRIQPPKEQLERPPPAPKPN